MDIIERVARSIDSVQLFVRYNDWTSDRVDGMPVEICRHLTEDVAEIEVVARFAADMDELEALNQCVSDFRARAAIEAMREPTEAMYAAAEREWDGRMSARSRGVWQAMIDAALKP